MICVPYFLIELVKRRIDVAAAASEANSKYSAFLGKDNIALSQTTLTARLPVNM